MSDTTEVLRDPRVQAYLRELHREVAAIDPAAADGLVAEIADHVRDAAAEPGFDLDVVLSDLGDPALIAAAVEPTPELVAESTAARASGWAWLDRWPAGIAVVLAPVLILASLTLFAVTGNPRAALTGGFGALALLGGLLVVLWMSRGWTRSDKVRGTTTLVLFALSLAVAPLVAPPPSGTTTCSGAQCTPAPGAETQPLTLLLQLAVPLMLLHAAHLSIRFRSAGSTGPLRVTRLAASGVVGLVVLGGVSFACFVAARFGVPMLLAGALPAMIVWVVGVVLLWRAEGWTAIDRVVGTFLLPVLVAVPLYAPLAMSATAVGASQSGMGTPGTTVAVGVFIACELLVALWLLIRFEPAHRA